MGKNRRSKEIYRKKSYTPKFQRDLAGEYNKFFEEFKKVPKKCIPDFLMDKFGRPGAEEKNPDLKIIVFCRNDTLREILIDLGNKGANLSVINDALKPPDIPKYVLNGHPIGLKVYNAELSPVWNEKIEEYQGKRKAFGQKEGHIKRYIKSIKSLEPIRESLTKYIEDIPNVNAQLKAAQDALESFEKILPQYLDAKAVQEGLIGYPIKWGLPVRKLLND